MEKTAPRIYRADNRFDCGLFGGVAALYREIRDNRTQVATLFGKQFRNAYRGAALGVFWNFALPLLPISAYVLLATLRVFPTREGIPAALFIAVGVTAWSLMTDLITEPMKVVRSRSTEAMKTALPLSASIASSTAMIAFDTSVRVAAVIILSLIYKVTPSIMAPTAILVLFAACVFGLSLGLLLAIFNVVSPDVERVVTVFLRYGIFVSGVIFPLPAIGALASLEIYNPFAAFIGAIREALYFGGFSYPLSLAAWSVVSFLLAIVASRIFYIMEYRIRGLS